MIVIFFMNRSKLVKLGGELSVRLAFAFLSISLIAQAAIITSVTCTVTSSLSGPLFSATDEDSCSGSAVSPFRGTLPGYTVSSEIGDFGGHSLSTKASNGFWSSPQDITSVTAS